MWNPALLPWYLGSLVSRFLIFQVVDMLSRVESQGTVIIREHVFAGKGA
jgi:hypothetical protein